MTKGRDAALCRAFPALSWWNQPMKLAIVSRNCTTEIGLAI